MELVAVDGELWGAFGGDGTQPELEEVSEGELRGWLR